MKCPRCGEDFAEMQLHLPWKSRSELLGALERNGWVRQRAADELGVCIRTVRNWIRQMRDAGFEIPDSTWKGGGRPKI
jgi:transposase